MDFKFKTGLLVALGSLFLIGAGGQSDSSSRVLREANQHFTYQGKPINPKVIQDLLPWISDQFSGPVAIDLKAIESNRYFGNVRLHDGWIETADSSQETSNFFGYQYVGRLENGLHVVHTASNEGGSGTFEDLVLIKFTTEDFYLEGEGKIKKGSRTVMNQVAVIPLGDRSNAKLSIKGNSVVVKTGNVEKRLNF